MLFEAFSSIAAGTLERVTLSRDGRGQPLGRATLEFSNEDAAGLVVASTGSHGEFFVAGQACIVSGGPRGRRQQKRHKPDAAAVAAEQKGDQMAACTAENGFTWDANSGYYFHQQSGYYYDPHTKVTVISWICVGCCAG